MSVNVDDPGTKRDTCLAVRAGAALVAMGILGRVQMPTPRAFAVGVALGLMVAASPRSEQTEDAFGFDWRLAQTEDRVDRLVGLLEQSAPVN
jgi:hypothetical protein